MSQDIYSDIDPTNTSGTELADLLNSFKDALMSGLKGPSRPTEVQAGGMWVDDSSAGILRLKFFTGTTDVTVFTLNLTTSTVSIQNSDDFFEITKISADAVGPYLSFQKKRIASGGQTLTGDVIGEMQIRGVGGGSPQLLGRVRYVASEDTTPTNGGGYYIFEGTRTGQSTLSEFMRLIDGRLAIGVTAPTHGIHLRSSTGIKNEVVADSATGPKDVLRKSRVAGSGQTLSGDELGSREYNSTDSAGTEFTGSKIVATADENHTPTLRGTKLSIQTVNKGSNVLAERVAIYEDKMDMAVTLAQESLDRKIQSVASVADLPNLDAQRSFIEITGVTAMTIRGVANTSKSRTFDLYNGTNQNIIFVNQDAGVPAADRIAVNGEPTLTLQPGKTVTVQKRTSTGFWHTLVEGNTGITYNEATALVAKMVARSFFPDVIDVPVVTINSTPSNVAIWGNGISPTLVTANPQAISAHGANNVVRMVAMKANLFGVWARIFDTNADYLSSLPDEVWERSTSFSLAGVAYSMPVRPAGTKRSYLAQLNDPAGITNYPVVNLFDTGIATASEWMDIANNGTTIIAVARAGTNRIGSIPVNLSSLIAVHNWTYLTNATIDVPLRSIANGGGRWVAVGGVVGASPNGAAWVSLNGTTWTSYAMPNQTTVEYKLVRYCNSQFVAAGGTAAAGMVILTSPDGQTWTQRAVASIGLTIKDFAFGGGLYIAFTDQNIAIISTDGVNWTEVSSLAIRSTKFVEGFGFISCPNVATGPVIYRSLTPSL